MGEKGYGKIYDSNMSNFVVGIVKTPIISPQGTNYQISCVDKDNDGFCNWGISENKPSTCPVSCKPEKDWDDSNPNIGALEYYTADITPPSLSVVTPVPTPTSDTTPDFTFSTDEAGTISYGGDCNSSTTSASAGNNTITFNTLSSGTHSNCNVTVTDAANNPSSPLAVPSFTESPSVPINSAANAVSWSQVDLSWDASQDIGVAGYHVYRNDSLIGATQNTFFSDTNLSPINTYYYTVTAYDAAGNESAQSLPVFATTLPRKYCSDDFNTLTQDWLQAKSSWTDINGDGIINSRDLGIMMSNWEQ